MTDASLQTDAPEPKRTFKGRIVHNFREMFLERFF